MGSPDFIQSIRFHSYRIVMRQFTEPAFEYKTRGEPNYEYEVPDTFMSMDSSCSDGTVHKQTFSLRRSFISKGKDAQLIALFRSVIYESTGGCRRGCALVHPQFCHSWDASRNFHVDSSVPTPTTLHWKHLLQQTDNNLCIAPRRCRDCQLLREEPKIPSPAARAPLGGTSWRKTPPTAEHHFE